MKRRKIKKTEKRQDRKLGGKDIYNRRRRMKERWRKKRRNKITKKGDRKVKHERYVIRGKKEEKK